VAIHRYLVAGTASLTNALEGPEHEFLVLLGLTGITADARYTETFTAANLSTWTATWSTPFAQESAWSSGTHGLGCHEKSDDSDAARRRAEARCGSLPPRQYQARWRADAITMAMTVPNSWRAELRSPTRV
jgi:hypothetical protein